MEEYLEKVDGIKESYAGFNLLLGELDSRSEFRMGYVSNREAGGRKGRILSGEEKKGNVEAVSNSTLGVEEGWPKVSSGSRAFGKVFEGAKKDEGELVEGLWEVLSFVLFLHSSDYGD